MAHYFGRRAFGSISGLVAPLQMGALGFGPFVAAMVFDLTGSYVPMFQALVGAYAVATLLMLLVRRPGAGGGLALAPAPQP